MALIILASLAVTAAAGTTAAYAVVSSRRRVQVRAVLKTEAEERLERLRTAPHWPDDLTAQHAA